MKSTILSFIIFVSAAFSVHSFGQATVLVPGKTIERKILKGENHLYTISLQKGGHAEFKVKTDSVWLKIEEIDSLLEKVKILITQNPSVLSQTISIDALKTGNCELNFFPMPPLSEYADSLKTEWLEANQGQYQISDVAKLTASEYKQKLDKIQDDKDSFSQWIKSNAHEIKTVDADNGFEDLQPFKRILKDVRVVALGEATHGTSEFFRMKHRMLEFLVKEMGFTSFYIEAPMSRFTYINDYVLYGIGDPDNVIAKIDAQTWRLEEARNLIGWMRQYNSSVTGDKKVRFFGFDDQANPHGWKGLKKFYEKVNVQKLVELDSLEIQAEAALKLAKETYHRLTKEEKALFKVVYLQSLVFMDDLILNEGKYEYLTDKNIYKENLGIVKLIVQELGHRYYGGSALRDNNMAENIFDFINQEKPETKVVLWAHNGHVAKDKMPSFTRMGCHLANILKTEYYAIGFEFYSGSFLSKNQDINNNSQIWDIMTVGAPPFESLPWYLNQAGKDKFFIDFRNTGANNIKNFPQPYQMHEIGTMFGTKWPITTPYFLKIFDGMIYIKESTATKSFTKVHLDIFN